MAGRRRVGTSAIATLSAVAMLVVLPAVARPPAAHAAVGNIVEYPTTGRSITAGPDGNMWLTQDNLGNTDDKIVRINPVGATITEFAVPTIAELHGITAGPDGNIWFTESGFSGSPDTSPTVAAKVGYLNPQSGAVTKFDVPRLGSFPRNITTGPDKNLWFTTYYGVGRITPQGVITEFPLPSFPDCRRPGGTAVSACPGAGDITTGPDGNLWFTGPRPTGGAKIVRLNPASEVFTEYLLPPRLSGPGGITAGSDLNLWFTDLNGRIGRITSGCVPSAGSDPICSDAAGVITEVAGTEGQPNDITAGPDGNLWYVTFPITKTSGSGDGTQSGGNKVGRITPTGVITEFAMPSAGNNSEGITPGPPGSGDLWYTGVTKTGRINALPPGDRYTPVAPARLCDTRGESFVPDTDQCKNRRLGPDQVLTIDVAGRGGVPPTGATGVVLNVTATAPSEVSYLTVFPAGVARPTTSNLNFVPGQHVANLVQVGLSPEGEVSIYNNAGSVDVVLDVAGYVAPSQANAGLFSPLVPARICDSRDDASYSAPANQCLGRPIAEDSILDVQVTGLGGVPATGVAAVVLNVTVANPSADSFFTVYPTGTPRPTASNLNFRAGQVVPNRVTVPVGAGGRISIYNDAGVADVIVDVGGYVHDALADSQPPPVGAAAFTGITPARLCDTRDLTYLDPNNACKGNTVGPDSTLEIAVADKAGVPAGVTAVVLNVTTVNQSEASFLTVYPGNLANRPTISDLNWSQFTTVANLVVVKLSPTGTIKAYNQLGNTDVVVDVVGWYA